jgi:hypothetical protein
MANYSITYAVLAAHSDGGQPIRNGIIAAKLYNG